MEDGVLSEDRAGFRLDRLRPAEWLIALAACALLVDLVAVPWYSLRDTFQNTSAEFGAATSATGLQAHHILGPLLLLCGALGLIAWLLQASSRAPSLPLVITVFTAMISFGVALAVLIRVVFDPPAVLLQGVSGVATTRTDVGAVVGVFLVWFLYAGCWWSLRTDGIAAADAPQRIERLSLTQRSA
jgi:hypothetical protein